MAGGGGHIGGDMSLMDILTYLYFTEMNVSPENRKSPDRDRFVLSKGHSMEAYYAVLCAKVAQEIDLGSHIMFIADLTDAFPIGNAPSATYTYYHKNIKPAPAKPKSKGWICTICGYIYEGEVLPEDFICPVCKHPASDFKRVE